MNNKVLPKVLHVLANSAPDLNGYAIRSHDLLVAQKKENIANVVAITSPFYPHNTNLQKDATIDGIAYYRCTIPQTKNSPLTKQPTPPKNSIIRFIYYRMKKIGRFFIRCIRPFNRKLSSLNKYFNQRKLMKKFEHHIINLAKSEEADIIHGHTPFRVGLPALRAARKIGLPYVHEMRGLWEDSAVAEGRWKQGSLRYKIFRSYENSILKKSDWVCTISHELSKDVITRNPKLRNRVTIVPNAVGTRFEKMAHKNEDINDEIRRIKEDLETCEGEVVVGYVGSIRKLEGVDETAKAIFYAKEQGVKFKFLVCSSKKNQDVLQKLCDELGISSQCLITGPVEHNIVHQIYSLIDIFVVSRPPFRVTKIVPPIKPLEAMIMGVPTICSDLPVLAEIITHQQNGFLFKAGDSKQLGKILIGESLDKKRLKDIGLEGKEFVASNRCWSTTVHTYSDVYAKILEA